MLRRTRLPVPRQIGSLRPTLAKTVNKKGAASDYLVENSEEGDDYVQEWSFPFPVQATLQSPGSRENNQHARQTLRPVTHSFARNISSAYSPAAIMVGFLTRQEELVAPSHKLLRSRRRRGGRFLRSCDGNLPLELRQFLGKFGQR